MVYESPTIWQYEQETTSSPLAGIDEISIEELEQGLKSMKNIKTAGPHVLNSELFKCGEPALSNSLLELINKFWKERYSRQVRVKPLFKKGKHYDCSNYRGISLLNSGYKTYGKIITQHFNTISEAILLEEQNWFRKGRSIIDNVFTIKTNNRKKKGIQPRNSYNLPGYRKSFW